jgi:hypothetical protein
MKDAKFLIILIEAVVLISGLVPVAGNAVIPEPAAVESNAVLNAAQDDVAYLDLSQTLDEALKEAAAEK